MTRGFRPAFDPWESRYWDCKARLYWRLFNSESVTDHDPSPEDVIRRLLELHELSEQDGPEGSP